MEFLEDLQTILSQRTVKGIPDETNPFGRDITKGLNCILDISESYGFRTYNLDNYIGYAEFGDGDEYVGVLGHIDVVPEGSGWDTDPFKPVIKDGKIYARGVLDDKGPLMASLYALKKIKDSNIKLSKKVRIIFGTNEESGTEDIDYYLKKEKPPIYCFTPDAYFPIVTSEKGIFTFEMVFKFKKPLDKYEIDYIKGGKRSNIVPNTCVCKLLHNNNKELIEALENDVLKEKYKIDLKYDEENILITGNGISCHGSTPESGENAIANTLLYLAETLKPKDDFGVFLSDFNRLIGKDYCGKKLGIDFSDKELGDLTLNLGLINGTKDEIRMRFNIRYPATVSYDSIFDNINNRLRESSFNFSMGNHNPPLYFPKDHALVKGLAKAYEETVMQEAKLLSIGGGTYAKLMPNTVAFGPLFSEKDNSAHQANEYIDICLLEKCIEIYTKAIYELAK